MIHLTLNTGHARVSPRAEVADHVLPIVAPLLKPGRHAVPGVIGGYELAVPVCEAGWLGTVYQATLPIATIGVAADDADAAVIWPALLAVYRQPAKMPQPPWCSVVLHLVAPAYDWLGDFERCLAWTWIESQ